jgi:hypothetical protein
LDSGTFNVTESVGRVGGARRVDDGAVAVADTVIVGLRCGTSGEQKDARNDQQTVIPGGPHRFQRSESSAIVTVAQRRRVTTQL